jgi:alkane 1-monooxygenase
MLWYHLIQPLYLLTVLVLFSQTAMLFALAAGVISFLFLECINYIEHYGLLRSKTPSGRYERVQTHHSWNSNYNIGRIVLYELTMKTWGMFEIVNLKIIEGKNGI